ncbi:MAG: enoyl-CoA hydratase-related protein [Bacteroidota bacterium]
MTTVELQIKDRIAVLTLSRPDRYNAINQELLHDLLSGLDQVKNDAALRALIITGAGKGFCAGADLDGFGDQPSGPDVRDQLVMYYGSIIRRITMLEIPVIAAINGAVAGAGIGIALACDYKLMAITAKLRYAFVNIGLSPDAGSGWFLARAVGYAKALEIAIDGEKIEAERCKELGLVSQVCPADQLLDQAHSLAKRLAERPPLAFASTKRIMRYALEHGLTDTIAYEAEQQMIPIQSHDHQEGVAAFLEKRKPKFTGH